ncbi:MAG: hypothetical protein KDN20_21045 [Verrucomicrobiae bacterium]|nr:hypothetical protein [Verrucomicrobiae bacterium]
MNSRQSEQPTGLGFTEIRFVGLRRSGTHAVQNWLISLYDGSVCYLNDVTGKRALKPDQPCDDLPTLRSPGKAARLDDVDKNLLLYAMEDRRLQFLRDYHFPYPPGCRRANRVVDVLLLRDPYNTIASRLKIGRDRGDNGFFRDMFLRRKDGTAFFPQLWKNYAREYLGELNCLRNEKIGIRHDRWTGDAAYRDEIGRRLGVGAAARARAEATVGQVPGWGFGSSFDATRYHGKAQEMDLMNRWRRYEDDAEFRELTADAELRELAERIFGVVIGR